MTARTQDIDPRLMLALIGAAWGLTLPLTRVAVSTGHQPLGLIVIQCVVVLSVLTMVLSRRPGRPFPLRRRHLPLFLAVALLGTLVPNSFSYRAAAELPAGIMAIATTVVPMFALPLAIALGLERFELRRLAGVLFGATAIVLLAGPEKSLPAGVSALWILVAIGAPVCWAMEEAVIAVRGTDGLDPVEVVWGATVLCLLLAVPLAVSTGQWVDPRPPWGIAEAALIGASLCHVMAYVGFVWLITRTGPVFASQVSYVVTATGVLWSIVLLGESYALWVWLAFGLMLAGVALVQPRPPEATSDP